MTGPERFSRLKFPIHKSQAKTLPDLFNELPGLRRYFQDPDRSESPLYPPGMLIKIIKYIVFLYDEQTDLTDEYPDDYRLRKDSAAKEAGFRRRDNGEWPDDLLAIMNLEDRDAVRWILDYLKVMKNKLWREIILLEEELDSITRQRMESINDFSKKDDLMPRSKIRIDELELRKKEFYANHDELKRATEKEIIPITPENVYKELDLPDSIKKIRQVKDVHSVSELS